MSLIRVNRFGPRGGARKTLKVKKKAAVRQEWDVSLGTISSVLGTGLSTPVKCCWDGSGCSGVGWVSGRVFGLGGKSRIFASFLLKSTLLRAITSSSSQELED